MYGYIYITTNLIDGKKYLGKHKATAFDEKYKGSGVYLNHAINKYGWDNFRCELLESFDTREELNAAEKKYIQKYDAVSSSEFYNIALGGEGGDTYSGLSSEDKEKFRQTSEERWKSITYREVVSERISDSLKGVPKSESHRQMLSKVCLEQGLRKGQKNGMYGVNRSGELAPNYGRHYYNNGTEEYLLYDDVYERDYKDRGFVKGRLQSRLDALHKDLSNRLRGNTYNKGKVRIHKDNLEKCITVEDLDSYLDDGWVRGRRPKQVN